MAVVIVGNHLLISYRTDSFNLDSMSTEALGPTEKQHECHGIFQGLEPGLLRGFCIPAFRCPGSTWVAATIAKKVPALLLPERQSEDMYLQSRKYRTVCRWFRVELTPYESTLGTYPLNMETTL
jgi:hypothetical protein